MDATRILLVDDDLCLLHILRFVLDADGIKAEKATSGAEAVALLDKMDFDLVITDFSMPVMNGVELAKIAKERFPHIPIIMITVGEFGGQRGIRGGEFGGQHTYFGSQHWTA